ncbi:MAG: sugar phosphate isomerase/epimerase [Rubellimicrobium sp.]|nr:sugar phosphate isomerase/epimerase [Rubellimicrobium sp.]
MKLSVTSWSFPELTLSEAGGIARTLGLEGIDIGLFYRAALDRVRLLTAPEAYAEEVAAAAGLPLSNLYYLFGADLADRNLALPRPAPGNPADFDKALAFCRAAGIPSLFILPGLVNPGQTRAEAFAASAEALRPLVAAGQQAGVTVTIEPHVHSLIETPEMAAEMIEAVPGLKLTLDPAHFTALGHRQDEIEALCPHAGHIHLRQARMGALQAKMGEGTINFPAFLGSLRDAGYDGWLSIEYVHQGYMNTLYDDVLTETVKMRDLVRGWLGET